MILCLCLISITTNAARVVNGINYEFDREKKLAYVVAADKSSPYTGDIVIPENVYVGVNEFTVVGINERAFDGSKITSVTLPSTIVEIQESAFEDCNSLTAVYLPDGITKIGKKAFAYCESLVEVRLSDNNEIEIGTEAFRGLTNLQSLTIPSSWTHIGDDVNRSIFRNCGIKRLTIGKNVKIIGAGSFSECDNLSEIICPSNSELEEIGRSAFSDCKSIPNLNFLPRNTKIIDTNAFAGCNLQEICLPSFLDVINYDFSWSQIAKKFVIRDGDNPCTFSGGRNIVYKTVYAYLGREMNCNYSTNGTAYMPFETTYLKRLDFGPRFKGGNGFKFGKNIKVIYSFVTDPSLITCEFEEDVYDNAILYVPVGKVDEYLAQDNFSNFFDVREFYPEGYFQIADETKGKIEFADIEVKNICLDHWDTDYDCELVPLEAEAVTDIGEVFKSSMITSFDELRYFKGLKTIPANAFRGCQYLESIKIPYTITKIDNYAFSTCAKLKSFIIEYNVTEIGDNAFSNCGNMVSLLIPPSVKSIGKRALFSCSSLNKIKCYATKVPQADASTFGYREGSITLFVPEKSIADYQAVEPWKNFKNMAVAHKEDVNNDSEVNTADIEDLVSYFMGILPKNFDFMSADVNGDGEINVADIVGIINAIQAK